MDTLDYIKVKPFFLLKKHHESSKKINLRLGKYICHIHVSVKRLVSRICKVYINQYKKGN